MKLLKHIAVSTFFLSVTTLAWAVGDIPISSNFQLNSGRPLDGRQVVPDTTTLYGLPSTQVYAGMEVYVQSDSRTYQLQGSTYNWVDISGGGKLGNYIMNQVTPQTSSYYNVNEGLAAGNIGIGGNFYSSGTFLTTGGIPYSGHLDASTLTNPLPAISGSLLYSLNPQALFGQFPNFQVSTPTIFNDGTNQPLWNQPDNSASYVGWQAGFDAQYTTGTWNTCMGSGCMFADPIPAAAFNTCVGAECLTSNVYGHDNTGLGYAALTNNTSGYYNVAVGVDAMNDNLTGFGNVAVGQYSMILSTNAQANVCEGYQACNNLQSSNNVDIGYQAGEAQTTGTGNILIGYGAGYYAPSSSNVVTGNYNTFVGEGTSWTGSGQPTNTIALGNHAAVSANNTAQIGGVIGSGNEVNTIVSTLTIAGLSAGQCLQTAGGGLVIGTGATCGSGGGGTGSNGILLEDSSNNLWSVTVGTGGNLITTSLGASPITPAPIYLTDSTSQQWKLTITTSGDLVTTKYP